MAGFRSKRMKISCNMPLPDALELIRTVVIVVSPPISVILAIVAWFRHRSISAKRAAVDFIKAELENEVLADARHHFLDLTRDDGRGLKELIEELEEPIEDSSKSPSEVSALVQSLVQESLAKVHLFLNHCELVAVAIHNRAMDERMYEDWRCTSYIEAWKRAEKFIEVRCRTRPHQPNLYRQFERLADRWQRRHSTFG